MNENKVVKAGFWSRHWQPVKQWLSDKHYNFRDQKRSHLVKIFIGLVGLAVGFVVIANVTPRPSNVKNTPLNQPQSFGDFGKEATLTKRTFDPKTKAMQLNFALDDSSGSLTPIVDTRQIKVSYDGDNYTTNNTKAFVVPTSTHSLVIRFENLNHNFRSVKVKFADKAIDTNTIDDESQSSVASNSKPTKQTPTTAEFIVNNDHLGTYHLAKLSQKALTLTQNIADMQTTKKYIASQKNTIRKWQEVINEQNTNIQLAQQNLNSVDDSSVQTLRAKIDSYQQQIDDAKQSIADTQQNIAGGHDRITKLERTRHEINRGDLNLPKPY